MLNGRLSYELNIFHNDLIDAVFRNNLAGPDEPINTNAGNIETWGHEHQAAYRSENWKLSLVGSFNNVIKTEDYLANSNEIYNIPNQTLNVIFDYQWQDNISSSIQLNYIGDRLSPVNISLNGVPVNDPFPNAGVSYQAPDNRLSSEVITNFSTKFNNVFGTKATLELHAFNLFDTTYFQGGTTLHPYQQEGRWLLAQLRYSF